MSWLLRVTDRLAQEVDEPLAVVLKRLYGPLLDISFIFPSWKRSDLKKTFTILGFYIFSLPPHLYLLSISMFCVQDDFDLVSLEFHYWLIFVLVIIMIGIMNTKRAHMVNAHQIIGSDLGHHASGRIYEDKLPTKFESEKRKQTMQFILLPMLVLLLASATLLVPYIKNMDGTVHYNSRGANMKLPIVGCYPFPTHEGILHVATVLGQLMAATCLALVVITLQFIIFRMTQELIFEYRVLQYALDTLFTRAKIMHKQLHPESDSSDLDVMDPDLQKSVGRCLKDCIDHHHNILKLLNEYVSIVEWPTAMAYFFGAGIIGLSLVNILAANKSGNYENIALFSLLAIGEVLSILMISLFGEVITTEDDKLRNSLYDTNWYWFDTTNKKTMLNFQTGLIQPAVVKTGGVANLNLETFSSIMNTAYSFFNLMNTQ